MKISTYCATGRRIRLWKPGAHPLGLLMSLMTVQAEMRKMRKAAQ